MGTDGTFTEKTWGKHGDRKHGDENMGTKTWGRKHGDRKHGDENMGTSMISKSQEETEVSLHLEEWGLEAKVVRLS